MTESLEPDPQLRAHLRAAAPSPPYDEVNFDALQARVLAEIRARALPVAVPSWWEHAAGWGRVAVPLALAASVLCAISLVRPSAVSRDVAVHRMAMTAHDRALHAAVLGPGDGATLVNSMAAEVVVDLLERAVWTAGGQ